MKTEHFSLGKKDDLFSKADSMHDCSFTAELDQSALTLVFERLEDYLDESPRFEGYKRLTVAYRNAEDLSLHLSFGRKSKTYFGTVSPLYGKRSVMRKFSVDTFDVLTLHFWVLIKGKLWEGKMEFSPDEIEYSWE